MLLVQLTIWTTQKDRRKKADEENRTDKWLLIASSDYRTVRMCVVSNEVARCTHKRTKHDQIVITSVQTEKHVLRSCHIVFDIYYFIYTTGIALLVNMLPLWPYQSSNFIISFINSKQTKEQNTFHIQRDWKHKNQDFFLVFSKSVGILFSAPALPPEVQFLPDKW